MPTWVPESNEEKSSCLVVRSCVSQEKRRARAWWSGAVFHKKREELVYGGQQLCFTRKEKSSCLVVRSCVSQEKRRSRAWWSGAVFHKKACSEAIVEMCQNVVFFEVGQEMEVDNVLKELTWDRCQGDGTVIHG